jgi:hypothetical protein
MKTPREILIKRHEAAQSKLDAMRREVVGEINRQGTRARSRKISLVPLCLGGFNKAWVELILPSRRIWAGLAATWLLLALVNLSTTSRSTAPMAAITPTPEMILTYRQQEKLLAELIGQNGPIMAEPRRKFLPAPRSEIRFELVTV